MLKIHINSENQAEIFSTIQGEGLDAGKAAIFIRLQGCSVHCFFCDEKETWVPKTNNSCEMNTDEILNSIYKLNVSTKRIVITGGEPSEQELRPLLQTLLDNGFELSIETAGTGRFLTDILTMQKNFPDQLKITFSPKEIYSAHSKIQDDNIWKQAKEIKFVIASEKAESYVSNTIIPKLDQFLNPATIFLVADWYDIDSYKGKCHTLAQLYPNRIRMGFQLHKLVDLP